MQRLQKQNSGTKNTTKTFEINESVFETKHSNCPVCAIGLSNDLQVLLFTKKLNYSEVLQKIIEVIGCVELSEEDLQKHIERHVNLVLNMEQKKVEKLAIINERVQRVREKLFEMENRGEVYSKGYESLNATLVQLLRILHDIESGTMTIDKVRIPVREFFYEKAKI
jgi:hypothetical protein